MRKMLDYSRPESPQGPDGFTRLSSFIAAMPAIWILMLSPLIIYFVHGGTGWTPNAIGFVTTAFVIIAFEAASIFRFAFATLMMTLAACAFAAVTLRHLPDLPLGGDHLFLSTLSLGWCAIVISGHVRWFLILRSKKGRPDSN